jgi:hypothetical protein
MVIPEDFKNKISDVFYDKLIKILNISQSIDDEGWAGDTSTTDKTSFYGNVTFKDLKILQEEQGLKEEVNIAVSCSTSVSIVVSNVIEYNSIKYRVISCIPYDSHKLILATKWSSKSSTLTSA